MGDNSAAETTGACPAERVNAAYKDTAGDRGRTRHGEPGQSPDDVARDVFRSVVGSADYPCVGARSVLRQDRADTHGYPELGSMRSARMLLTDLTRFARTVDLDRGFASFIAVFLHDPKCDESGFEELLWRQLQHIHDLDDTSPDRTVSPDPADPNFGLSIAGTAYFVIGLHPAASRPARRSPLPMMAFNMHEQFESLRAAGRFDRIRDTIRRRDADVAGDINPMVADHGEASEAAQYSGRRVGPEWRAPFRP